MRKIMLCGALQCEIGNFGDDLLRQILINNLMKYDNTFEIVDYSKSTSLKEMNECEYFIFIPGGYLGYIERWYSGSFKKTMQRVSRYYYPGLKAVLLKKKIILLAQGIGPYEYPVLDKMLGLIAKRAVLISVRDWKGKRLLQKSGADKKKIYVTADTAQTLTAHDFIKECRESQRIKENFAGKTVIFIHYSNVKEYLKFVYQAVKELFFPREDICFVIGADDGSNYADVKKFASKFPRNRCISYDYKSVSQLVTIINSVDCVITGKFHVGIVGCTLSKSVLSFSCQYAKTSLYYGQIGYPERCKDIFEISYNEVKNNIARFYSEKIKIPDNILKKADYNYRLLEKVIDC